MKQILQKAAGFLALGWLLSLFSRLNFSGWSWLEKFSQSLAGSITLHAIFLLLLYGISIVMIFILYAAIDKAREWATDHQEDPGQIILPTSLLSEEEQLLKSVETADQLHTINTCGLLAASPLAAIAAIGQPHFGWFVVITFLTCSLFAAGLAFFNNKTDPPRA